MKSFNFPKIIVAPLFVSILFLTLCLTAVPTAQADTIDDVSALSSKISELTTEIDIVQSEYIASHQALEQTRAEKAALETELDEIQSVLDENTKRLASYVRSEYKNSNNAILEAIIVAPTVGDVLKNYEYVNSITKQKTNLIESVKGLRTEQTDRLLAMNEKEHLLEEQILHSKENKDRLESDIAQARTELNSMKDSITSSLASTSGYDQLEKSLSYLDALETMTEQQESIITSAYNTPYSGYNLCETWAEAVYRNAGISVPMFATAYDNYAQYCVSTDKDNIKPGAYVYGSGTHSTANHVGISVGEGLVMDNEASRNKTAVTLGSWLSWQTTTSARNGMTGWMGWGYPPGVDFQ